MSHLEEPLPGDLVTLRVIPRSPAQRLIGIVVEGTRMVRDVLDHDVAEVLVLWSGKSGPCTSIPISALNVISRL